MDHKKLTSASTQGVHSIYAYVYADATERTSATGFTVEDIGKVAKQLSDGTKWILKGVSPVSWGAFNQGIQLVGAYQRTLSVNILFNDWITIGAEDADGFARISSPGGGAVETYIFRLSLDVVAGVNTNVSIRLVFTSDGYFAIPGGTTTREFADADSTGIDLLATYTFDPGSITGYEVQLLGTSDIGVSATVSRLCFTVEKNSIS